MNEKTCLTCGSVNVSITDESASKEGVHYTTTCQNPTCLKINKVSAIMDVR